MECHHRLANMGVDAPGFDTVASCCDVVDGRDHVLRKRQELGDFHRLSVGGKDEVFVVHLEAGGEEISARILKAHAINDRYCRSSESRAVGSKLFNKCPRLSAVQEHRPRIGLEVKQSTRLANRFCERFFPLRESELSLLTRSAEGEEGLSLLIDIDGIARPCPNVVAWFKN